VSSFTLLRFLDLLDNIDTTRNGSLNYGYHLSADQSLNINVDLVNYKKEAQKIFLTYDLEIVDGKVGTNSQGTLLSVTGCAARNIKVASGRPTNTTSNRFYFYRDGAIVNGSTWQIPSPQMANLTKAFQGDTSTMAASRWTCSSTTNTFARPRPCTVGPAAR
jgi:hypothetical protein